MNDSEASTRVNTPVPKEILDSDSLQGDGDSDYHDATRINSIDLEIAEKEGKDVAKPAVESKKDSEKREQEDLLRLVDQEDPLQWPLWKKWSITILMGTIYFNSSMTSSMITGAAQEYETRFRASPIIVSLLLSLYLLGFALGPMFFAPFSEVFGRKAALLLAVPCFLLFNVGCALTDDIVTLLILRVFAGFFGACPQSNAGATISDMFSPRERLWPMFTYTVSAFGGPIFGPLLGGFIYVSGNYAWIFWTISIFAGVNLLFIVVLQEETYVPVLHKRKARKLRQNGHPTLYAPAEMQGVSVVEMARVYVSRPLIMLFKELPLIYAAGWTGFTYSIIFMFFEAYPVIFQGIYGMNAGEEGLCFLGLGVGILLSTPVVWYFNRVSIQMSKKAGKVIPEARLQQVMLSAPLFVIGFFWFGWTARAEIPWIVPVIGSLPIGASLVLSFNALNVYVSQCYPLHAASALGAMAFSRCFFALFVPLFARQMFVNLGPGWASSILGFTSLLAIPIPIIFYRWGGRIRDSSKMATGS